jgi:hypothetical protein
MPTERRSGTQRTLPFRKTTRTRGWAEKRTPEPCEVALGQTYQYEYASGVLPKSRMLVSIAETLSSSTGRHQRIAERLDLERRRTSMWKRVGLLVQGGFSLLCRYV